MKEIILPEMNPELVSSEIMQFIVDRVKRVDSTGCVIGLSGGIDSSLSAALARRAFENYASGLELVGYIMPSDVNNPADAEDAINFAESQGIRYGVVDISPVVESYRMSNPETFADRRALGNLRSRVRANILSTKAEIEKKTVCGTGNKDEDYGLGYYTLFGDGAVHMSPIAGLSKRLVREMALYLGLSQEQAYRVPTAGLEPGQSDFRDLGYSYLVAETVIEGRDQGFSLDELKKHPQVINLVEQGNSDYARQFGKAKFSDVGEVVDDIMYRHQGARFKFEVLSPPTPDITLQYR